VCFLLPDILVLELSTVRDLDNFSASQHFSLSSGSDTKFYQMIGAVRYTNNGSHFIPYVKDEMNENNYCELNDLNEPTTVPATTEQFSSLMLCVYRAIDYSDYLVVRNFASCTELNEINRTRNMFYETLHFEKGKVKLPKLQP
jgi:hypothetical protein